MYRDVCTKGQERGSRLHIGWMEGRKTSKILVQNA